MAQTKERDPRQTSAARLAAVQGHYEVEITGARLDTVFLDFNEKRWRTRSIYYNIKSKNIELAEPDKNKFSQILNGVRKNLSQIDNTLSSALENEREIEHLDALLRGVLRAGIFELFFRLCFCCRCPTHVSSSMLTFVSCKPWRRNTNGNPRKYE